MGPLTSWAFWLMHWGGCNITRGIPVPNTQLNLTVRKLSDIQKKKSILWEAKQIEKNFSRLKKTKGIGWQTTTDQIWGQRNIALKDKIAMWTMLLDNSVYQWHCLHLVVVLGYVRKCFCSWELCAEVFRDEGLSCLRHPQIVQKK